MNAFIQNNNTSAINNNNNKHKNKASQGQAPRSGSSCAACKLLKRRCSPGCIFAPYFRSDEPKKFAKVHKVFGASNVSKILVDVPEEHREDAVNSLAYEADARLRDPVYGCIGAIALLESRMLQLQHDLALARARLARYASSSSSSSAAAPAPASFSGGFPAAIGGTAVGLQDCDAGAVTAGALGLYDETANYGFSGGGGGGGSGSGGCGGVGGYYMGFAEFGQPPFPI